MGKVVKLKRGDLRGALIDYALNAAKLGHIEVMSLRQAARDLGVSSGAVYRHFADKDALFLEIVRIGFHNLRDLFTAIRPENEPATTQDQAIRRCFQLAHTFIHWADENTALWHMMFGRVGMQCRDDLMEDPEMARYTPFDVTLGITHDLYAVGVLESEPDIQDIRYMWSATHGAAVLAQTGARLDFEQLDMICDETAFRNLRAIGLKMDRQEIRTRYAKNLTAG